MQPRPDAIELLVIPDQPDEVGIPNANLRENPILLTLAEGLVWVDQGAQVIIVDEVRKRTYTLQGVEAVLWGWLALEYSYLKLIELLAAVYQKTIQEAETILVAVLDKWRADGLMVLKEKRDG